VAEASELLSSSVAAILAVIVAEASELLPLSSAWIVAVTTPADRVVAAGASVVAAAKHLYQQQKYH
jgi:hypothetical protein